MEAHLKYLGGYSQQVKGQVLRLIQGDGLQDFLLERYASTQLHEVRSDKALLAYVMELKNQCMRRGVAPSKVVFDNKLKVVQHALGTHTSISRVQGSRLKNKREIRIASLFKDLPEPMLRMIVVHELAHLKEKSHNKAFYQLCCYMDENYHQREFEVRLYLTWQDLQRARCGAAKPLWAKAVD